jgi:hypothetical protein
LTVAGAGRIVPARSSLGVRRDGRPGVLDLTLRGGALAGLAFALACRATSGPVDAPLADVASVQLIDSGGYYVTPHLPLYPGYTELVYVHLFEASGQEVAHLTDRPVQFGVTFVPSSLATAVTDSTILMARVTPTAAVGTSGTWTVQLHSPSTMTTKAFGPFTVFIH